MLVFLLFSSIAVLGMLWLSGITGMARYGTIFPVDIPEQAEERLEYGTFPDIEQRTIMGYEERGVSARIASYNRHVTPKKAPLQSPSQLTDSFCIKSNGLEGRVYLLDQVESGYGQNCEWYVDAYGRSTDYVFCCDPFTGIDPGPIWREWT